MILRLFKSRRGDGGRARQRLVWTLLSAGRHSHSPKDQPLGYSFGSPCPAQVFYLPLSFSQVPGNKWAGQGKVLAAGDDKNKTKQKNTRFQRKDAKNGSPGRGWQSQLVRKDQGAQLCFGEDPGASSGRVSRAVMCAGLRDCCSGGGFQSWPHSRPGHRTGRGSAAASRREGHAWRLGRPGQSPGLLLSTRTKSAPAKERGRGGGFCGS